MKVWVIVWVFEVNKVVGLFECVFGVDSEVLVNCIIEVQWVVIDCIVSVWVEWCDVVEYVLY